MPIVSLQTSRVPVLPSPVMPASGLKTSKKSKLTPKSSIVKLPAAKKPAKISAAAPAVSPKAKAKASKSLGNELHPSSSGDDFVLNSDHVTVEAVSSATAVTLSKKNKKALVSEPRGVVYIGRLPHGFFEDQIKAFLGQFGEVVHVKVSRNKKTGKSKHYAFVEFKFKEVASIVAETMNGYFLNGRSLTAKVVDNDSIHADMFKGCDRPFVKINWKQQALEQQNMQRSSAQKYQRAKRLVQREGKRRDQLKALGVDVDYVGYKEQFPSKGQHVRFD